MEQLNSRDALRGTGRTTHALRTAVEYARACAKPDQSPAAFLVVSNKEQWDYIKVIASKELGMTKIDHQQRRLDFGTASIFVRTPEDADRNMRGYRHPIILDHSVMENIDMYGAAYRRNVDVMHHLYADRIV